MSTTLGTLRATGRERFASLGLPTPRLEAWKFTNLAALGRIPFQVAPPESARISVDALPTVVPAGEPPSHRLVFVNGHWRPDLSSVGALPAGVVLSGMAAAQTSHPGLLEERLGRIGAVDGHAMLALNAAHAVDGAVVRIPPGVQLDRPIELVFIGAGSETPLSWHPRLLILAEAASRATVIEHHVGRGGHQTFGNLATELLIGTGASLRHYKAQREGAEAFHIATLTGRLEAGAAYEGFLLTLGARLARDEIRLTLDGPGASVVFGGAYLARGRQHSDITTMIDHARPGCSSRQLIKGVLDDEARGVFQGQVLVRPDAQRTDAHQLNRALLLSDSAQVDTKPELIIHADDVKCSHGATCGDLDDDAMFYLRARGIDRDAARALLIGAYVGEAIAGISEDPARVAFESLAAGWLKTV